MSVLWNVELAEEAVAVEAVVVVASMTFGFFMSGFRCVLRRSPLHHVLRCCCALVEVELPCCCALVEVE